jgi:hypothetical protein
MAECSGQGQLTDLSPWRAELKYGRFNEWNLDQGLDVESHPAGIRGLDSLP